MKANYKNWVPKGMLWGLGAGAVVCALFLALLAVFHNFISGTITWILSIVLACGLVILLVALVWAVNAYNSFSYNGKRQLSRAIIEGTADYVHVPDGGKILDVGCGSGALAIACAKRNPKAEVVGIDRWGKEYASFSQNLCETNASAEGVANISFRKGDATKLNFPDESFDAVTSNYVYHNIMGVDKQALLLETLRVLKKGGTFAIHDIMSFRRYGDMEAFCAKLRSMGYEEVSCIDTANGKFMAAKEALLLELKGSTLLVGRK
ncbi:MAG: methyltransferase domain-containing protein [Eubacteriales bacterium]|nr:methyltransferase domain-containing protein [Eubacteriales bacterium]